MAKKKAKKKKAPKPAPAPAEAPQPAAPAQPMPAQMPAGQPMMQPGMQQPGMPAMQQPGMAQPGMQQPGMPAQPGMQQPGMPAQPGMPQPGMPPQQGNPMMQMMQMMQMMSGGGGGMPMGVDPAAVPFQTGEVVADQDDGLDSDIIRPAMLENLVKTQQAVTLGSVLDLLCLTEDGEHALGGVPQGCTLAMSGPPGKGKTRTTLSGLARVAQSGERVALIVAEEGFHSDAECGRDDLCSRMVKIGMAATGLSEKAFTNDVLKNVYVMESQYHKGHTWDDFVGKYRYLVEQAEISFVLIDSLNMLDPTKNHTADNLSALKTYNHEQGITCICTGQIRDTGAPVGGEALMHTADVVFLIEEMGLGSKEIAEQWGGKYREKINVIRAVKSVTTPTFPHPIRIDREAVTGAMVVHESQPEEFSVLPVA